MPFNWQTFRVRALSSIVFVILMLLGLLWNHWSFLALFSFIHFGCWVEYVRLVERIDPDYASISPLHRYGVMIAGWGFMLWMTSAAYTISGLRIADIGFWMLVAGAVAVNIETVISRRGKLIAHSLMGLLYISLSLGLLIYLSGMVIDFHLHDTYYVVEGVVLPVLIILCMWINDTMAYLVGSVIGKTPFSKISPKKTWEGTIGGVVLCVVIVGLSMSVIATGIDSFHWYVIAAIAAIMGTLGDLFESKLKRLAGVKDSGQMMPGHGGFLDRFDSLLLATPFVWAYVWLVLGT